MTQRLEFGRGFHVGAGRRVDIAAYDGYIGRWSRLCVPAVLSVAEIRSGDQVLDLATGPGEAALIALPLVAPSGFVVGADISEPMLETARTRLGSSSFLPVAADGQALPFRDGSFDAVVCQLGLQFLPDPSRGLEEAHRVLRAGRRAAVCVIGKPEQAPMWGILAEALSRHLPEQRDMLHLSFALSDVDQLARLLTTAGFRDVVVERDTRNGTIESFEAYWSNLEAGAGMLPQAYLSLPEASRSAVREQVQTGLSAFESGGKLVLSVEMLIGAGRA